MAWIRAHAGPFRSSASWLEFQPQDQPTLAGRIVMLLKPKVCATAELWSARKAACVMELDKLSDAESKELASLLEKVRAEEGDERSGERVLEAIMEFMEEKGRIPTPVDDGPSGWFARVT